MLKTLFLLLLLSLVGTSTAGNLTSEESSEAVQKFLENLETSIASKNVALIEKFFDKNFVYKGCEKDMKQETIVELLALISANTSFEFKSAIPVDNTNVAFNLTVLAFGEPFDVELIINLPEQLIKEGKHLECQKKAAAIMARKFLKHAQEMIRTANKTGMEALFKKDFLLKSCHNVNFTPEQIVTCFMHKHVHAPPRSSIKLDLLSVEMVEDNYIGINIVLSGNSPVPIKAILFLDKKQQKLNGGEVNMPCIGDGLKDASKNTTVSV